MEHDFIVISSRGVIGYRIDQPSLVSALLSNQGKAALANAMAAPIKRHPNYSGLAKRVLSIEPLPQGAQLTYDRVPDVVDCIVDSYKHDSIIITSRHTMVTPNYIGGARVVVPIFEVYENPSVNISEIKSRRFDILDRYKK